MDYQGEGEGEVGRETAWVAGKKLGLSGQDEQEFEKLHLSKLGCLVGWRVMGYRRESDKYEAEQEVGVGKSGAQLGEGEVEKEVGM